jgi:hypothetical protein
MTESLSAEIAEFYNIATNTAKAMRSAWEEIHDYEAIKRHLAPDGVLTHLTDTHGAVSSLLLHLLEGMANIAGECLEHCTPGQHIYETLPIAESAAPTC